MNGIGISARIARINAIDLEPIMVKLMDEQHGNGWSYELTAAAVEQYRRFLILNVLHPDTSIVPSKVVDEVWHTHILDTRKYAEDCEHALGFFLHHFPYFGIRGQEDAENLEVAFANTTTLMREMFGEGYELPNELKQELSPAICDAGAAICDSQAAICDQNSSICDASASICDATTGRPQERPRLSAAA